MEHWLSLVAASFAGIFSHIFIFIHHEWHLHATTLLQLYLSAFGTMFLVEGLLLERSWLTGAMETARLFSAYTFSLFTSITIYRLLFHELCRYRGPRLASISKLWHIAHCRHSKNHLLMERLHQKYGDFVRTGEVVPPLSKICILTLATGPNELTIFDPDVLRIVNDGLKNACTKPAWYDNLRPYTGLNTHRSKLVHKHRRRVWDHGFTTEGVICASTSSRIWLTWPSFGEVRNSSQIFRIPAGADFRRQSWPED